MKILHKYNLDVVFIFVAWFFWLIWPSKCLILMILTMPTYHEILLRDSRLSSLSIVNFFSSLETKKILKIPIETFLRITRYQCITQCKFAIAWHYARPDLFVVNVHTAINDINDVMQSKLVPFLNNLDSILINNVPRKFFSCYN